MDRAIFGIINQRFSGTRSPPRGLGGILQWSLLSGIFTIFVASKCAASEPDACIAPQADGYACVNDADFKKLATYANDTVALQRARIAMVMAQLCTVIPAKTPIYVDKTAYSRNLKKVRPAGELQSLWVFESDVKMGNDCVGRSKAVAMPENKPEASTVVETTKTAVSTRTKPADPVYQKAKPNCEYKSVMTDDDMAKCR
jgi:hypothetical protein